MLLLQKGCTVIVEEPPKFISVKQGSVWGMSPRNAKKVISCRLSSAGSGTRIAFSSTLASDWKNLTIIGSALSVIVASLCWWISVDLEGFVATRQPTWWSWIATSGNFVNLEAARAFVSLTRELAAFLGIVIFLEVIIYLYAKSRIDGFAEETLKTMP